ncbi:MAG: helix-turn-helix domain-containing protein [Treponema sp.]|nr:helix-turn-helix domain-containing protein [Treponema sp.]
MIRRYAYPVIDTKATGANIKRLREYEDLSVKEMQSVFDFKSPQAVYKWQRGETLPTVDEFVVLAKMFNTPIEKIIVVNIE